MARIPAWNGAFQLSIQDLMRRRPVLEKAARDTLCGSPVHRLLVQIARHGFVQIAVLSAFDHAPIACGGFAAANSLLPEDHGHRLVEVAVDHQQGPAPPGLILSTDAKRSSLVFDSSQATLSDFQRDVGEAGERRFQDQGAA
jgi:hypothetical protein